MSLSLSIRSFSKVELPCKVKVMDQHVPVMANEVFEGLRLGPGSVYADGTFGLGGHARIALEQIGPNGIAVGFDWDKSMLDRASGPDWEKHGKFLTLVHADYRRMPEILREMGLRPNGILLDMGLNSLQIADPERGISFSGNAPLEMRMDRSSGEPASALLNRLSPGELENILWNYGDERWAKAIAFKIVERRKSFPLAMTNDLVEAVLAAVPIKARDKRIHPATRTFQAIRIATNRELEGLDEAVMDAARCLAPGGRIAAVTFHSGEDRAVKQAFRFLSDQEEFALVNKKPILPLPSEVKSNPRSRSAKLRLLERTK